MLQSLGKIRQYEMDKDTPDMRGWDAYSRDGNLLGKVDDLIVETERDRENRMPVRYLSISYDHSNRLIPASLIDVDENKHLVRLDKVNRDNIDQYSEYRGGEIVERPESRRVAGLAPTEEKLPTAAREFHVRLQEEHLAIDKKLEKTGEAVIRKTVETHPELHEVELRREHIEIEHRPINKPLRETDFKAEKSFEPLQEIHIPLMAEEAVVKKEPYVKEEVVIRKDVDYEKKTIRENVRNENIEFVSAEPDKTMLDRKRLDEKK
ncbi:MAG TPA: hypothetical protein DD435_15645 [Cyanobacteria bacterium UBA8530]|nr:hypothetical protein [Cyanobacteria bacterium UBA8530]